MDEIYGRENTEVFIWNKEAEGKSGTLKQVKRIRNTHEYIIASYQNKFLIQFNQISEPLYSKDQKAILQTANLAVNEGRAKPGHPNWFEITAPNGRVWYKHWKFDNETVKKYLDEDLIYFGKDGNNQPRLIIPTDERRKVYLSSIINKGSTTVGRNELDELFQKQVFSYPKPEKLIQSLIETATNSNDIVLDFHLGSGTTAAVAHKMGRQYIGVEQMDYIETIAVERLKKVITGEQGGISKAVGWQGGGEFVYAELAPFNETARQQILACKNFDELSVFFNTLCQHYFLDHHVSVTQFTQLMTENDFKQLSLDEQKQMMIDMLDLNQLYINLSDQDDSQFDGSLSDEDKRLSLAFYGEKS